MSFFDNTRKPVGLGGRLMVFAMNVGHRAPADRGFRFVSVSADAQALDCGAKNRRVCRKVLK